MRSTPTLPVRPFLILVLLLGVLPLPLTAAAQGGTAKVVVYKTTSAGARLAGACFDVWTDAGNGALGRFVGGDCDAFDAAPNNGRVEIGGLAAGRHVLVETRAPDGYQLASKRRFSVRAGQRLPMAVKDYRGGLRLTVEKRDENGSAVVDACFGVSPNVGGVPGPYVAFGCDGYDGLDGSTTIVGLRPGAYVLWAGYVPEGYLDGPVVPFTVAAGEATKTIAYAKHSETSPSNVEVRAVDGAGALLPGACFSLWTNAGNSALGEFVAESCDAWDGRGDGRTFFVEIAAGSYVVLEHRAPAGYVLGKKVGFTKSEGRLRQLTLGQTRGGVGLTVTTLEGDTTRRLPGACYNLFRRLSSGGFEVVSFACDGADGANDGVTRFAGLTARTYGLLQSLTPNGYRRPPEQTFAVRSTSVARTVRTYASGVRAAEAAAEAAGPAASPSPTAPPAETAAPSPTAEPAAPTEAPTEAPTATAVPTETPAPTEAPTATSEPPTSTPTPTDAPPPPAEAPAGAEPTAEPGA